MAPYVGLDVSMDETAACVIDDEGEVLVETKVAREPEAIATCLEPRAGAKGVLGDALARAIDDDRLVAASARTTLLRSSCPIQMPSRGGPTPTANRSLESQRIHFALAPDYRSLSKYEGREGRRVETARPSRKAPPC